MQEVSARNQANSAEQEMGLHLPVEDDSRFSPEDRNMRIRIFWSGKFSGAVAI